MPQVFEQRESPKLVVGGPPGSCPSSRQPDRVLHLRAAETTSASSSTRAATTFERMGRATSSSPSSYRSTVAASTSRSRAWAPNSASMSTMVAWRNRAWSGGVQPSSGGAASHSPGWSVVVIGFRGRPIGTARSRKPPARRARRSETTSPVPSSLGWLSRTMGGCVLCFRGALPSGSPASASVEEQNEPVARIRTFFTDSEQL